MNYNSQATDIEGINIEFIDVTLLNSIWKIHGLNLIMEKTNLAKTLLYMVKQSHKSQMNFVNISNSTFGSLITYKYEITISDSNIDGTTRLNNTLVDITDSNLTIVNSRLFNISSAIINAFTSHIKIQDVKISESGYNSDLIQVRNDSELIVQASIFENNENANIISVLVNSFASIKNSNFLKNSGGEDNCIAYGYNATVFVYESLFFENHYQLGSVINSNLPQQSQLSSRFSCLECKFINNSLTAFKVSLSELFLNKSILTNFNWIESIWITQSFVEISGCTFSGDGRTCIKSHGDSKIIITNNSFTAQWPIAIEHSVLQIMDSTFWCEKNCVVASNLSVVEVAHSQFTKCGYVSDEYSACFAMMFSSLNVSHTTFELIHSRSVIVQFATATFTNCLLQVAEVIFAYETTMVIKNSTITHCNDSHMSETTMALIYMFGTCHLYIIDSNITGNTLNNLRPFVNFEQGTITLSNCLYARNTMTSHLVAPNNTIVTITSCQFINNTVIPSTRISYGILVTENCNIAIHHSHFVRNTGRMLSNDYGVVNVQECSFNNNSAPNDYLIVMDTSKSVNFTGCFFTQNVADNLLIMQSDYSNLQFYNCLFKNNTIEVSTIKAFDTVDVIIDHVSAHFCSDPLKCNGKDIIIQGNVQNVRIHGSMFRGVNQFLFDCYLLFRRCSTQLFTLQSNFSISNKTLQTNTTDFLKKVEAMEFISTGSGNKLAQEEIKYASSKYRIQWQSNLHYPSPVRFD